MKFLAVIIGKCASFLLRLMHHGGSLPGKLAMRIYPELFSLFHIPCDIIVVTGTNGKTSTSNMIADLFAQHHQIVIANRKGDNLKEGIATTLLNGATLRGNIKADIIVLETDELNVPYIMAHLSVSCLVITNFFRDQLDRSQEMEQLIHKIEAALVPFRGTLILNGNDPNVVRVKDHAPNAKVIYFNAQHCDASTTQTTEASEGKFCPRCNAPLRYAYYQYSHIGEFHCTQCAFQTPKCDFTATQIQVESGSFTVSNQVFQAPIPSLYSIYNSMAVIAVASAFSLPLSLCNQVFRQVRQPAGRNETFLRHGHKYTLNLVKNPTGANEVLKTIALDQEEKALMIVLNDHAQDGTDVSWIYDAQFERVLSLSTHTIICAGTRAYDMALRIKYANYEGTLLIKEDYHEALQALYELQIRGYVIATYTALAPVRNAMRKEGK